MLHASWFISSQQNELTPSVFSRAAISMGIAAIPPPHCVVFVKSKQWRKHFAENISVLISSQSALFKMNSHLRHIATLLAYLSVCILFRELLPGWIRCLLCYLSPQPECYLIFLLSVQIFREVMGKL